MRSTAFGHTTWKSGLGGLPAPEHKLKLSENDISISTFGDPVFDNLPAGEIEHLMQRIIVGKAWLVLGDLAELAVESPNDIGHAIDFLEKERILFPFFNLLWYTDDKLVIMRTSKLFKGVVNEQIS